MTESIRVISCDIPGSIGGYTIKTPDGVFTIVLNSNHCPERNMKAYHHEMTHIENGDYDKKSPVDILEVFAHELH